MGVTSSLLPSTLIGSVVAGGPRPASALSDTALADLPALLLPALGETLTMVGIVMVLVVAIGTPIAVCLHNMAPGGLFENPKVYGILSWIVNIGRSLPFLVLMAAIVPFTRFITGTNIGIAAAVVPMTLAGIPFFARIVENSLRDVPRSVTQAAKASGGSTLQIIRTAQLGEAVPAIMGGLTINTIAMIEYSAIAGTIGAGGIGYVAVTYGYQRFDNTVMLATVILLILLVTTVQLVGDRLVKVTTPHLRRRA
ncbi:ABC-type methionine transport system permease subunit [Neomicrococcus aestuarii]|uniref:ABC-type methionine transport system permease subunit n=1 Tax=Neomicrococcus aestuarii TaxID=556325 RepID=A0A7W8WZ72_9MICC|nr:methionine ABC transporter permease [Neomicrococcus aestuarii]MBB5511518.1 ABC-type methionine transport system permease subunit [Neomicrococcus aestuarii]